MTSLQIFGLLGYLEHPRKLWRTRNRIQSSEEFFSRCSFRSHWIENFSRILKNVELSRTRNRPRFSFFQIPIYALVNRDGSSHVTHRGVGPRERVRSINSFKSRGVQTTLLPSTIPHLHTFTYTHTHQRSHARMPAKV